MGNTFQTILLAMFGIIAVIAVVMFAGYSGSNTSTYVGDVKMWGTVPAKDLEKFIAESNSANSKRFNIIYSEKNPATIEDDLISAMASGAGPDVYIFPQYQIARHANKIVPIDYITLPERTFKDTFIDEGNMFLLPDGILALPLYVDPLVLYWNKDIFSSSGLSRPPKTWTELLDMIPRVTIANERGDISQATIGLGSWNNVTHAKDIIATFLLQGGDDIVSLGAGSGNMFAAGLNSGGGVAAASFRFYGDFSNSSKDRVYAWNSELPASRRAFESGILGMYIGYASEWGDIKRASPHLNFDVALIPQRDAAKSKVVYGNVYGMAVTRSAKNPAVMQGLVMELSGADFAAGFAKAINLPPTRRDLLATVSPDPVMDVFNNASLIARAWYDPSPAETSTLFKDTIESILSGSQTPESAVGIANQRLNILVETANKLNTPAK